VKKRLFLFFAALVGFIVLTTIAWMMPCPDLPTTPVNANYVIYGVNSFFDITLSGIGSGFDISDGVYRGWCIEDNHMANTTPVYLHCSYSASLPANLGFTPWDLVNYLLNHKQGTWQDVQAALWLLVWGSSSTLPVTPTAEAMVADALANGPGYIPGPGEVVAIILYTGDGIGIGYGGWQDAIIEIPIPGGFAGCTPGYWKNHLDSWAATGYSPGDDFDATFGTDFFAPDITLDDAANLGGGGINKTARHGTAALLSAAHPEVNYPYTVAEVIAYVQTGNIEPLVIANELGCSID